MESKKYWEYRYFMGDTSGYGSYDEQLDLKLEEIGKLTDISSITEIGCGDFHFGEKVMELFPGSYYGYDIATNIVERNQKKWPQYHFFDLTKKLLIPNADLVLCVDVLFHILDDHEYQEVLKLLDGLWTRYLVITAYERDQTEGLAPHVRIRKFDPEIFGKPIVRRIVEKDGEMYLYIFER